MFTTSDLHVVETRPLVRPSVLHGELPITPTAAHTVQTARQRIQAILHGQDQRLLVIVGPCSVHDVAAAREYAAAIAPVQQRHSEQLELVMRVYFEKPRLEGTDQRSPSRRQLRHQHGPAHRPGIAAARGRDGSAGGH